MVILFLVPYLGLSGALTPITPIIAASLHTTEQTLGIGYGLANAGYAVGTVLAVALAQRLPQRRLTVVYAALLVIGSVLAAAANGPAMFITGHVLQGVCTSLLLIASTPPLILGYPVKKLRLTAVIFNLCIFGAVAAGPLIGGAQASFHAWRPLFWIVAGVAFLGLVMSLLTFSDAPPADPSAPRDPVAVGLAATGSVAAFFGAAQLLTHGFFDPVAIVPLLVGIALIVTLVVYEYRASHPLLILRSLTTTIPVTGIVVAMCAAAAATSAVALTATVQAGQYTPLRLGLLYVPELAAAVVTAIVFGRVFSTRFIHYYALSGLVILAAGILVLRAVIPATSALTLAGSALVGIGIGASVVPALFIAGYSLRSAAIQRVFAILELLRAIAAFLVTPILLHFAVTLTGLPSPAFNTAMWVCFGLAAGGAVAAVLLYVLGRVRPMAAAIETWMGGMEPAWESPPLLASLRPGAPLPTLARTAAAAALASSSRLVTGSASLPHRHAAPEPESVGPVLFAYDGSRLAKAAIAEAGRQLPPGRNALVLTVWRTFNVGFIPEPGAQFDAACADAVGEAAEQTAAHGAELAEAAGFPAQSLAVQGTPASKSVSDAADDHDASLIVLGTHRRAGIGGLVAGSIAAEVTARTQRPVMIVHEQDGHRSHGQRPLPELPGGWLPGGSRVPVHGRVRGYQQLERRTLAHGAVHPDGAVVGLGDRRHGRQPEPESAGLPAPVGRRAGEPAEDPFQVGFRYAAAGVRHPEDDMLVFDAGAEFDAVVLVRVRDGVFQQCVKRGGQPVGVTGDSHLRHFPQPPPACRVAPAVQRFEHDQVDPDRRHVKETRAAGRGKQQHAA
jgi:MFS family permease/nucleotide-binding universal stress UspA family protein